ncbi:MAG: hypothetical protein DCC75_09415 [Proteobacteria bacterium]|nr:MAG: hypothetical protein DCC75_09415 [Pseudomonadota bacterium]
MKRRSPLKIKSVSKSVGRSGAKSKPAKMPLRDRGADSEVASFEFSYDWSLEIKALQAQNFRDINQALKALAKSAVDKLELEDEARERVMETLMLSIETDESLQMELRDLLKINS